MAPPSTTTSTTPSNTLRPADLIGSHIKLVDTQNNTIEDESGDQHVTSKRKSFRTIHANKGIKEIISIDKPDTPTVPFYNTPLPQMNLEKIEETVERALEERRKKLGQGVTNRAQHIFDVLSKTLPTRWDPQDRGTIVVLEDIRIKSPYGPEDVAGAPNEASRTRIQRILEGEQEKLEKEISAMKLKAANAGGERKKITGGDSEYKYKPRREDRDGANRDSGRRRSYNKQQK